MTKTDSERLFKKAAELLRRDGWVRFRFGPIHKGSQGPRCALGAMTAAANELGLAENFVDDTAYDMVLAETGGKALISDWNDYTVTCEADVLRVFDKLAGEPRQGDT